LIELNDGMHEHENMLKNICWCFWKKF